MDQSLKGFFRRISAKLALLLTGAVAISGSKAMFASSFSGGFANGPQVEAPGSSRKMPSKLVLRKTRNGVTLIAQHSSHSSHASHASHASHSSHSSHSSHASRAI